MDRFLSHVPALRFNSIQSKLIVLIVGTALIAIVALAVVNIFDAQSREKDNGIDKLQANAALNASATAEMERAATGVSDSVGSIAAVAEQNSAATHEVSSSAQELSAQAQQVTSQTHVLGQMAEDLKQQIAAFKLRGGAAVSPVRLHKAEEADEADEIAA